MNDGRGRDPDCRRCRHLQITWQPERPYGCRAFGFRSKRLPALEVRLASGTPCLRFVARVREGASGEGGGKT
ncbi:MAG: uracil-DNA glycosylase [Zetaproteobacteria bacterium]|nr:MAG: uracil-DNA glycosylase [Zetaproteobacteria bacterium]